MSMPVKHPGPDHPITIARNPRRVTVSVAGRIIADTQAALTLSEASYRAVQYIPRQDVDMALLFSKGEPNAASDEKTIKKFIKAGESMGIDVEVIERNDYGRLAEFDALFIRDNTSVTGYTFRFARRCIQTNPLPELHL